MDSHPRNAGAWGDRASQTGSTSGPDGVDAGVFDRGDDAIALAAKPGATLLASVIAAMGHEGEEAIAGTGAVDNQTNGRARIDGAKMEDLMDWVGGR
jgi:hypothetical protein